MPCMAKPKGAIDYQMKILLILLFLIGSTAWGKEINKQVPMVWPLETIQTVPFQKKSELSDNSIHLIDRLPELKQYPCFKCHKGKTVKKDPTLKKDQKTHDHIIINHGSMEKVPCDTCHSKEEAEKLVTMEEEAPLNQAPLLCSMCHSTQYKDWLHGAHGKRVGSWQGERVIYSCTQCHNPHKPGFEKRMPARGPKINRLEGLK